MSILVNYSRRLKIKLPPKQSAFLWGARKVGKSSYLKNHFPKSLYYDLLQSDIYLNFLKEPHRFREELLALNPSAEKQPIILDEVQKIPLLLDEVHWLIENKGYQFILCGSSARKLKRGQANLLGGRAWRYEMFPLSFSEMPDFDLGKALNQGLIPSHYLSPNYKKSLKAYVEDYLTQEIKAEGLTRNLPAFAKFLDVVSYSNAELVSFTNIASDCGVDSKTVKEYFQILVDTHLGTLIQPFQKKKGRKTISATPKFYLFDVGLANFLSRVTLEDLRGFNAGKAFENLILMELIAYRSYEDKDYQIDFWRTKTDLEVDFVLGGGTVSIEAKITDNAKKKDFHGLRALMEETKPEKAILVCNEKRPRLVQSDKGHPISILPWKTFLEELWGGKVI